MYSCKGHAFNLKSTDAVVCINKSGSLFSLILLAVWCAIVTGQNQSLGSAGSASSQGVRGFSLQPSHVSWMTLLFPAISSYYS